MPAEANAAPGLAGDEELAMEEPRQRIVVDAVSFGQIFRFHHILRSITHALHPPRLVVAFLTVLALVAGGRTWDALFEDDAEFHPNGLMHEEMPRSGQAVQATLEVIARGSEWVRSELDKPEGERRHKGLKSSWGNIDPPELRMLLAEGEASARARRVEAEVPPAELERRDAEFAVLLRQIDAVTPRTVFHATVEQACRSFVAVVQGVFVLSPAQVYAAFKSMIIDMPVTLWDRRPGFVLVYGLFALVVISIGGGAVCRMAACEFAGRERLRVTDAFDFATRSWVRLVLAPLLPLLIAGILAVVLVVGGRALTLPWIDVVGGLVYGLGLVIGFLIAFVLLAYAASFLMVLPAVATENCGPADAIQRAFAYLLSRPLHLLGYAVTGLVGMSIGYVVIALIAVTTLNATGAATRTLADSPVVAGTGNYEIFDLNPPLGEVQKEWHEAWGAAFVQFWQWIVVLLVVAYVVSYVFSSSTIIYMLMRKTVDDQDPSEIWRPGLVPGTLAPLPARSTANAASEPGSSTSA